MKIDGQIPQNIEPFNEGAGQTGQSEIAGQTFGADSIQKFQDASFADGSVDIADLEKQKQAAALAQQQQQMEELQKEQAAAQGQQQTEDDSGFKATDLIPFGIGNWFDGEGTFASDLGKTILSIACPIPVVSGLLANWGGEWLGNAIVDTADWVGGAISDAASWTEGAVEDAAGAVGDAVSDAAGAVGDAAGDVADAVGDAAGAVGDAVSDALDW